MSQRYSPTYRQTERQTYGQIERLLTIVLSSMSFVEMFSMTILDKIDDDNFKRIEGMNDDYVENGEQEYEHVNCNGQTDSQIFV